MIFFTEMLDEVFFASSQCKKSSVANEKISINIQWKELLNNVLRTSNLDIKTIIVNGLE